MAGFDRMRRESRVVRNDSGRKSPVIKLQVTTDPGLVQPRILRRLAAAEGIDLGRRAARILKLLGAG